MRTEILEYCKQFTQHQIRQIGPRLGPILDDVEIKDALADFPVLPAYSLIIINDLDRSTPSAFLLRALRDLGKINHPVTYAIASGTHKPIDIATAQALTESRPADQILIHDANNNAQMMLYGHTSRGTPVRALKILRDASFIVAINGVAPHYFAGFTGGVKSLIPGLAAKETTVSNHRWAMDPASQVMKTTGNPVFEDLWEACGLIRPPDEIYAIQIVNHGSDLYYITHGPLQDAFNRAKEQSQTIYGIESNRPVDRIISLVEPPLDKNLYQAQKAMENTKCLLRSGGSFILVAACQDGIGNDAFFSRLESASSPVAVLNTLDPERYQFGDHKAHHWAELAEKVELYYCGEIESDKITKCFMQKVEIEEILTLITQWVKNGDILYLDLAGGYTAARLV